jgi:hypothetical protein
VLAIRLSECLVKPRCISKANFFLALLARGRMSASWRPWRAAFLFFFLKPLISFFFLLMAVARAKGEGAVLPWPVGGLEHGLPPPLASSLTMAAGSFFCAVSRAHTVPTSFRHRPCAPAVCFHVSHAHAGACVFRLHIRTVYAPLLPMRMHVGRLRPLGDAPIVAEAGGSHCNMCNTRSTFAISR